MSSISIDLVSDAKGAVMGAKQAAEGLEDIQSTLDDLVHASQSDSRKIGDALQDGTQKGVRDSQGEVAKLERTFRDLATETAQDTKKIQRSLSQDVTKGTHDAGQGLSEFKDEAKGTAREAAASFDGSAQSIVGAFQEVSANAFIGFGPAGMAAGLAAAAGIGIISTVLQTSGEDAAKLREEVSALTTELIQSGSKGGPSLDYLVSKMQGLATAAEGVNLAQLASTAKDAGSDFKDLAQAYAGNTEGLKKLWREGVAYEKQLNAEADAQDQTTNAGVRRYSQLVKQADAQKKYVDYLGQSLGTAKKAAEAEELYAKAGGPELEAKAQRQQELADEEAARLDRLTKKREAAAEAQRASLETIDDAYDAAAGASKEFWDEENDVFDTESYIQSMAERAQALKDYQETLASSPLSQSAKTFLESQGVDAASQFLSGYKAATPEQQKELNRIWTEAGLQGSGAFVSSLTKNMPATVPGPRVMLYADDSDVQAKLASFRTNPVNVPVSLRVLEGPGGRTR